MKYIALTGFMTLYVTVLPVLIIYLVCNLTLRRFKPDNFATQTG